MDDLTAFLRARLDEREAVALAAQGTTEGRWKQDDPVRAHGRIIDDYGDTVTYDEGAPSEAQAVHIVDNDPQFVLADIAAKRQIIDLYAEHAEYDDPENSYEHATGRICGLGEALRLLAQPYVGHPEFREDWRV